MGASGRIHEKSAEDMKKTTTATLVTTIHVFVFALSRIP